MGPENLGDRVAGLAVGNGLHRLPLAAFEFVSTSNGSAHTGLESLGDQRVPFKFYLPLRAPTGGDSSGVAHFVYRDPSALTGQLEPKLNARKAAHYGLRIRGLGWNKLGPAKLDATVLRIALLRKGTARRFDFQAGSDDLPVAGQPAKSRLVPKSDRVSGGR